MAAADASSVNLIQPERRKEQQQQRRRLLTTAAAVQQLSDAGFVDPYDSPCDLHGSPDEGSFLPVLFVEEDTARTTRARVREEVQLRVNLPLLADAVFLCSYKCHDSSAALMHNMEYSARRIIGQAAVMSGAATAKLISTDCSARERFGRANWTGGTAHRSLTPKKEIQKKNVTSLCSLGDRLLRDLR